MSKKSLIFLFYSISALATEVNPTQDIAQKQIENATVLSKEIMKVGGCETNEKTGVINLKLKFTTEKLVRSLMTVDYSGMKGTMKFLDMNHFTISNVNDEIVQFWGPLAKESCEKLKTTFEAHLENKTPGSQNCGAGVISGDRNSGKTDMLIRDVEKIVPNSSSKQ